MRHHVITFLLINTKQICQHFYSLRLYIEPLCSHCRKSDTVPNFPGNLRERNNERRRTKICWKRDNQFSAERSYWYCIDVMCYVQSLCSSLDMSLDIRGIRPCSNSLTTPSQRACVFRSDSWGLANANSDWIPSLSLSNHRIEQVWSKDFFV